MPSRENFGQALPTDHAKYARVFGNLPIDYTSTLTDDQDRIEYIMDIGDHYVNVPAKNILMEFYMQSISVMYYDIPMAMLSGMIATAFPYIWRAFNGLPSFRNDKQETLEMLMIFPKFLYYMMNFVLLYMTKSIAHKKLHLKQMFMTLIEPATIVHSSIQNVKMSIPYAPISSDLHSCENLTNLFYLIKKFDLQFWSRGEVYGTVIFGFFALQLAYITLQVYVQKIDFFNIGKWDPENDKTPGVQLQIANSGLTFMIVTIIIV